MKERSHEIQMLVEHLTRCHNGRQVAYYTDLDGIVPGSSTFNRSKLTYALNVVKGMGLLFTCIISVGYRPLFDDVVKTVQDNRTKKIKSQTRIWKKEINTIDYSLLSDEEKKLYDRSKLKIGMYELLLSPKSDNIHDSIVARRCANSDKNRRVEMGMDAIKEAFKALSMT